MNNKNFQFNKKSIIKEKKYNDNEINYLNYQEAIIIDRRTYIDYYMSLLKRKQSIIFTFYINDDYNSRCMKICLFLFSFVVYYSVNTLFFDDKTMHKIYEDNGEYKLLYRLPIIICSDILTKFFSLLLFELLMNFQDNFIELKIYLNSSEKILIKNDIKTHKRTIKNKPNIISKSPDKKPMDNKINKADKGKNIKKSFLFKRKIFYIIIIVFNIIGWYYVSCFFSVFENTQKHLFRDFLYGIPTNILNCFLLSLIYFFAKIIIIRGNSSHSKRLLYTILNLNIMKFIIEETIGILMLELAELIQK